MELKFDKNHEDNRTQLDSCKLNGIIDPEYAKIITKVVQDFNDQTYWEKKVKVLDDFNANFMMPWELWQTLYNNLNSSYATNQAFIILAAAPNNYFRGFRHKQIAREAYSKTKFLYGHIYGDARGTINDFKEMNVKESLIQDVSHLEGHLKFPHWELYYVWKCYEKNLCTFPSDFMIKTFEKMKALHKSLELIDSDEDDEKWFKTILEVEEYDPDFIEQITEHRLGQDLSQKKLWKLYIEFLKKRKNIQKLLQTYSKYCRFYLSDLEMKEEYRKTAEKFGPSKVWWQNPFDFEIYESVDPDPKPSVTSLTISIVPKKKKKGRITLFSTNTKFLSQNLSFKDTVIFYIFKNANPKTMKKLLLSCKEFYLRFLNPIVYKLILEESSRFSTEFYEDSIKICAANDSIILEDWPTFHLSTAFYVFGKEKQTNLLKNFLPKFFKCDAKYLEINEQFLTYNELKFLIGHGKVLELILDKVIITFDEKNGDIVPLEDILALTPLIEVVRIIRIYNFITPQTSKILSKLPFKNQIRDLYFSYVTVNLEPYDFMKFLENTLGYSSVITLFGERIPGGEWKDFAEIMQLYKIIKERIRRKWGLQGPRFNTG